MEAPRYSGVGIMGFTTFDAMRYESELWWAQYEGRDVSCAAIGAFCEGLWYDSSSGQWGYDLSNPAILYRWEVWVSEPGRQDGQIYVALSFDQAGSISSYWQAVFEPARLRAQLFAALEKSGLLDILGQPAEDHGASLIFAVPDTNLKDVLRVLGNKSVFKSGSLYGLHAGQVGCPPCTDYRSITGVLGPRSLQVVMNTTTGRMYADTDQFNPYQSPLQFLGHSLEVMRGFLFGWGR